MEIKGNFARLNPFERGLVGLDTGPVGALYRFFIGFVVIPIASVLTIDDGGGDWIFLGFALVVLALVRVIAWIFRALIPFSAPVQEIWSARRQMGKRYDSYQWRKLLWIGSGLAFYATIFNQWNRTRGAVCSFFVTAGILGTWRWRNLEKRDKP